jgi:hypothetical protein
VRFKEELRVRDAANQRDTPFGNREMEENRDWIINAGTAVEQACFESS